MSDTLSAVQFQKAFGTNILVDSASTGGIYNFVNNVYSHNKTYVGAQNIYFAGAYNGAVPAEYASDLCENQSVIRSYIIKTDSCGNKVWAKMIGTLLGDLIINSMEVIDTGANAGIYVGGQYKHNSPTVTPYNINLGNIGSDISSNGFVAKYNLNGDLQWSYGVFITTDPNGISSTLDLQVTGISVSSGGIAVATNAAPATTLTLYLRTNAPGTTTTTIGTGSVPNASRRNSIIFVILHTTTSLSLYSGFKLFNESSFASRYANNIKLRDNSLILSITDNNDTFIYFDIYIYNINSGSTINNERSFFSISMMSSSTNYYLYNSAIVSNGSNAYIYGTRGNMSYANYDSIGQINIPGSIMANEGIGSAMHLIYRLTDNSNTVVWAKQFTVRDASGAILTDKTKTSLIKSQGAYTTPTAVYITGTFGSDNGLSGPSVNTTNYQIWERFSSSDVVSRITGLPDTSNNSCAFIMKYRHDGTFLWAKVVNNSGSDNIYGLALLGNEIVLHRSENIGASSGITYIERYIDLSENPAFYIIPPDYSAVDNEIVLNFVNKNASNTTIELNGREITSVSSSTTTYTITSPDVGANNIKITTTGNATGSPLSASTVYYKYITTLSTVQFQKAFGTTSALYMSSRFNTTDYPFADATNSKKKTYAGQSNMYFAGSYNGTVPAEYASDLSNTPSVTRSYIINTDMCGNKIWAKMVGTLLGNCNIECLDVVESGAYEGIYVGGSYTHNNPTVTLYNFNVNDIGNTSTNGFVAKYDLNGNLQWCHRIITDNTCAALCISVSTMGVFINIEASSKSSATLNIEINKAGAVTFGNISNFRTYVSFPAIRGFNSNGSVLTQYNTISYAAPSFDGRYTYVYDIKARADALYTSSYNAAGLTNTNVFYKYDSGGALVYSKLLTASDSNNPIFTTSIATSTTNAYAYGCRGKRFYRTDGGDQITGVPNADVSNILIDDGSGTAMHLISYTHAGMLAWVKQFTVRGASSQVLTSSSTTPTIQSQCAYSTETALYITGSVGYKNTTVDTTNYQIVERGASGVTSRLVIPNTQNNSCAFIMKYRLDGTYVWGKVIQNPGQDSLYGINVTGNNILMHRFESESITYVERYIDSAEDGVLAITSSTNNLTFINNNNAATTVFLNDVSATTLSAGVTSYTFTSGLKEGTNTVRLETRGISNTLISAIGTFTFANGPFSITSVSPTSVNLFTVDIIFVNNNNAATTVFLNDISAANLSIGATSYRLTGLRNGNNVIKLETTGIASLTTISVQRSYTPTFNILANTDIEYGKAYVQIQSPFDLSTYNLIGSTDDISYTRIATNVSGETIINVLSRNQPYYIKAQIDGIDSSSYTVMIHPNDPKTVVWGSNTIALNISGNVYDTARKLPECVSIPLLSDKKITKIVSSTNAYVIIADNKVYVVGLYVNGGSGIPNAREVLFGSQSITDISNIYSTGSAFALLNKLGEVYIFGSEASGGFQSTPTTLAINVGKVDVSGVNSSGTGTSLQNVKNIFSNTISFSAQGVNVVTGAFAALTNSGEVYVWGAAASGGSGLVTAGAPRAVRLDVSTGGSLANIANIYTTQTAFAAINASKQVYVWGTVANGGSGLVTAGAPRAVLIDISGEGALTNVDEVIANQTAFAARANGNVYIWGSNFNGGSGFVTSGAPRSYHLDICGGSGGFLTNVTKLYNSSSAFAALTGSGEIYVWGFGFGGGSDLYAVGSPKAVRLDLSGTGTLYGNIKNIVSSASAFAILDNSGEVYVWGSAFNGGSGITTTASPRAIRLDMSGGTNGPIQNIQQIYTNQNTFAALTNSGEIYVWGGSFQGGSSLTTAGSIKAIQLKTPDNMIIKDITNIYGTYNSYLAVSANKMYTWGEPTYGGSGYITYPYIYALEIPYINSSFIYNYTSNIYSMIKTSLNLIAGANSGLYIAGNVSLGNIDNLNYNIIARNIKEFYFNRYNNWITGTHQAAINTSDEVVAWGLPSSGGSNDGYNSISIDISDGSVRRLNNVKQLYKSSGAFAALDNSGLVYVWGNNASGGSGINTPDNIKAIRLDISGPNGSGIDGPLANVKTIYENNSSFAALTTQREIYVWGTTGGGSGLVTMGSIRGVRLDVSGPNGSGSGGPLKNIVNVYSNFFGTYAALDQSGQIYIWGSDAYIGSKITTPGAPRAIRLNVTSSTTAVTNIKYIHLGFQSAAAISYTGEVYIWGILDYGGSGSDPARASILTVSGINPMGGVGGVMSNVKDIYNNYVAFAALTHSGEVYIWGFLTAGGNTSNIAIRLDVSGANGSTIGGPLKNVKCIYNNTCGSLNTSFVALTNSGEVYVWGNAQFGGSGLTTTNVVRAIRLNVFDPITQQTTPLQNIKKIYSNRGSHVAIDTAGDIYVWGNPTSGGSGLVTVGSIAAIKLKTYINNTDVILKNIADVYIGNYNSYALRTISNEYYTWGASPGGSEFNVYPSIYAEKIYPPVATPLAATMDVASLVIPNTQTRTLTAIPTGASPPYSYSWKKGTDTLTDQSGATISIVNNYEVADISSSITYTCMVSSGEDIVNVSATVIFLPYKSLTLDISSESIIVYRNPYDSSFSRPISVMASHGLAPYIYAWSGITSSDSSAVLFAKTSISNEIISVNVSDDLSASKIKQFYITYSNPIPSQSTMPDTYELFINSENKIVGTLEATGGRGNTSTLSVLSYASNVQTRAIAYKLSESTTNVNEITYILDYDRYDDAGVKIVSILGNPDTYATIVFTVPSGKFIKLVWNNNTTVEYDADTDEITEYFECTLVKGNTINNKTTFTYTGPNSPTTIIGYLPSPPQPTDDLYNDIKQYNVVSNKYIIYSSGPIVYNAIFITKTRFPITQ
jgi:alpha-tubulin suppressor-like RCC1 family protein